MTTLYTITEIKKMNAERAKKYRKDKIKRFRSNCASYARNANLYREVDEYFRFEFI